jgi:hypothetical protein
MWIYIHFFLATSVIQIWYKYFKYFRQTKNHAIISEDECVDEENIHTHTSSHKNECVKAILYENRIIGNVLS